jgi:DNA-binding transcriptional ArsR family regulator
MAKAKPAAGTRPKSKHLAELTGRASELASLLLSAVALESYDDCCGVEELAARLQTTAGHLRPTLRTLEDAGLVTVRGDDSFTVYPTVKMLREQNRRISIERAEELIRRFEKAQQRKQSA